MARDRQEQDSGLGVVYGNLSPAAARRPRRSWRRFRRTWMVLAVLGTAGLIAAPAIVYAGMLPSAPAPAASVVPAAIASSAPSPSPVVPGDITAAEITAGTVDLPQVPNGWTCPLSGVRATADPPAAGGIWLTTLANGDVDGDGVTTDAVAVFRCVLKESAGPEVAVAFVREQTGPGVLGTVTTTGADAQWLTAVSITPGTVTIKTGDLQPYADQPADWTRYQDREHWYTGDGEFTSAGLTFPPPVNPQVRAPADLSVRTGDLAYDEEGVGTLSLVVSNGGPVPADDVWVSLDFGGALAERTQGWNRCREVVAAAPWAVPAPAPVALTGLTPTPPPGTGWLTPGGAAPVQCALGDIAVGEQVSMLLVVTRATTPAAAGAVAVCRRALGGEPVADLAAEDNYSTFGIH